MARNRGFTVIELMVVVGIIAVLTGLVVFTGRSARQNAGMAAGAQDLMLRIQGLKGLALGDGTDYLLVVVDADSTDRAACAQDRTKCARFFVLRNPASTFALGSFSTSNPAANAVYEDGDYLPRGAVLDTTSSWTPPSPFDGVTAWNSAIRTTCSGRTCFALRFTASGEVLPEAPIDPIPAGFTFVVSPLVPDTKASERRAIFVSFPAGIVKTAAF